MRLLCLFILITLYGFDVTIGLSNDIVASLRCKLLCKNASGFSHEVTDENFCKCKIRNQLSDEKLARIQELSTYYKLPVLLELNQVKVTHRTKRQLDVNLLEDLQAKFDQHKQEWDENVENLKSWHEDIAPKLEERKQLWKENVDNLRSWHEGQLEQTDPLLGDIAPKLEEHRQQWEDDMKTWKEEQLDPLLEDIGPKFDEHQQQLQETFQTWKEEELDPMLELVPKLEDLKSTWKDKPLLGQIGPKLEEHKQRWEDKLRTWQDEQMTHGEPILGQMAPSLTAYDAKATGVGGGYVNFPPANHPNPFVPPLAHIINALPIPRFNVQPEVFNMPVGAARPHAPPVRILPRIWQPHIPAPAPMLPARFKGPYDPANPIVVQPIVLPSRDFTPRPILHGLRDSVDDMLKSMKKNGGRLVPENFLNSDALSNSESQVNQINVNVRVEPTPTPPNLFSMFLPYNRPFLAAAAPKPDVRELEVTENPGNTDRSDENDQNEHVDNADEEEEDEHEENVEVEEEMRMQEELKDIDQTKFETHIADSVKKNLPDINRNNADEVEIDDDDEELDDGKYNNNGLIVQPKQYMQDTEEDLETLAK